MGVRFRALKAIVLTAAALGAAVAVWTALTLPPRPLVLPAPSWTVPIGVVRGALHVHSRRSDGTGSVEEIARAASRAGLSFVILTDHGDGTREPDPPSYHAGVLCIDGVEISSSGGHYVAIGMKRAPYPLGGEARDVVEDVRRLGGFGVVAHPDSRKQGLGWNAWEAPFDAIEWLNTDSEWRDESRLGLVKLLLGYPVRGASAIAMMLRRPGALLDKWDDLTRRRPVVALAGADAHARFAIQAGRDPYRGWSLPGFPSYESSFRVFAVRVDVGRPFTGSAEEDAARLLSSLRQGRAYTAIDALAGPAAFEFTATSGVERASTGGYLDPDGPVTLQVRVNAPRGARVVLRGNGRVVAQATDGNLSHAGTPEPAVYRVEVEVPGAAGSSPVPWLVSNPIYVGTPLPTPPITSFQPAQRWLALLDPHDLSSWHVENDVRSEATLARSESAQGGGVSLTYRIGAGQPAGQYVALVRPFAPASLLVFERIAFRGRSAQPMRLSVQVRGPGGHDGQRWQRSVYLDENPRDIAVFVNDMRPIGPTDSVEPDRRRIDGLLLVVDTTNARGGTTGNLWLSDVRLEK